MQISAGKSDAAFGWVTGTAPLVNENGRAAPGLGVRPVPIHHQHQIIQRIAAPQVFMAVLIWCQNVMIVGNVAQVIGPQIARANRFGPSGWARDAVGAVQHSSDMMLSDWGGTVAFALVCRKPPFADRARQKAAAKANSARR